MSKRKLPVRDPFAEREAEKYENPIPSREYILEILEAADYPVTHEQLCEMLNITEEEPVEAVRRRLIAMARDGQLISNRRDAFVPIGKIALIRGRVQGHRDGYGFLIPSEGGEDIYLHNRQMRRVFDGDEVLIRLSGELHRGKQEGAIVEVLTRNTERLAGRFFNEDGVQYVRPENPRITQDIIIPSDQAGGAVHGQIVVAAIMQQPDKNRVPVGRIVQVLGDHMAPGMEIDLAIESHGIPRDWPAEVVAEAAAIAPDVDEADKAHRVDLRHLPLMTIDGEDARDFDDAVFCEKRRGGWRLYVAIADVSHYVQNESPLDMEARNRGNSVYFPDFVVPMLPEALSNGLCSLNPRVDRLCMVAEINVSLKGRVTGYQFYEAVMHSHARFTYTQVGAILQNDSERGAEWRKEFAPMVPHLEALHQLYQCLRNAREERGAIDFETVETRILFNEDRKIERIVPVVRNDAHKLIEECMLCANVCAADFLQKHNLIGLYRVHEGPTEAKLNNLRAFLGELGLSLAGGDKPTSLDYQALMQQIEGRADAHLIQTVMLRSLRQAVYQLENLGHFGLGYQAYTHFTSPIRRYPDLLTHRAIRSVIRSSIDSKHVRRVEGAEPIPLRKIYPYSLNEMLVFGEQCSRTERRADEATRDVVSWLKCEYLRDQVGAVYDGHVSSVTSFGLFVELNDLYVEGLVHITSLPHDYYRHDAAQQRLLGERTRKTFGLGDELVVRVVRVDLDNRKIDFEIAEGEPIRKAKKNVKPKSSRVAKAIAKDVEAAGATAPKRKSVEKASEAVAIDAPLASSVDRKSKAAAKALLKEAKFLLANKKAGGFTDADIALLKEAERLAKEADAEQRQSKSRGAKTGRSTEGKAKLGKAATTRPSTKSGSRGKKR
ncbi:MAG: ribonuclease R [Cellvibrio sp.]